MLKATVNGTFFWDTVYIHIHAYVIIYSSIQTILRCSVASIAKQANVNESEQNGRQLPHLTAENSAEFPAQK